MNKEERIKQEEIVKQNFYEIIRFGIVGVIATIIHYGIYLAFKSYNTFMDSVFHWLWNKFSMQFLFIKQIYF